jgi:glutathione synthase/RimK-type ligase-like ATP-grasp enzyme
VTPRLAIHLRPSSFSDRWVESCRAHDIPWVAVDCLGSEILERLRPVDGLLWHWVQQDAREQLVARSVIRSAEAMGVAVFPSTATCWHFDDKLAQKYLLEAAGAPLAPTHVFFDLDVALRWIDGASFPKVFKLRRGAGSGNVRLVRSARAARAVARRAFGRGFPPVPGYGRDMSKRIRGARTRREILGALRRLPATLAAIRRINREMGPEAGYVYFQDYIAGNTYDTRVTVIGERAFAFTRDVRPGDFRASGSGRLVYDSKRIDPRCVEIAFEVARKTGSQSMAFDFVHSPRREPLILEVSYCYAPAAVYDCPGHWDARMVWHEGRVWPQDAILADLLDLIAVRPRSRSAP